MKNEVKIRILKTIHTLIWLLFNVVIFYMLYASLTGKLDKWLWTGFGLVFMEGLTLLIFKWSCPLTVIARRYTNETERDNFDIYLPNWLARHTKRIYTSLFVAILIITLARISGIWH